ncbi:uncharacterized protein LOC123309942 [Coccinella septempunctata]|uniref:uncharacterized protein LOC123309942 n=1 Tax=Coccinella septempunctata TaxID=41139 RepID=UPI001D095439|nr:uncharacterized protein LOC123309942 [Coccinella septempunctata]
MASASASAPRRNENEKKINSSQYHERNRTFSSTTTNHYKNKLAQIGIQKDLREILERKKLEKEHEQNNQSPPTNLSNEQSQISRKVRFVEERTPLRRSKSFTSGTTKNYDYNLQGYNDTEVKEKSPPKKFNKSFKGKRKEYFDLQNPTNIKIELQADSGERKCILDESVSLTTIKCDLKHCRNILNHSENKEKTASQANSKERNRDKFKSLSGDHGKSFNKKNRGSLEKSIRNEELESNQNTSSNTDN